MERRALLRGAIRNTTEILVATILVSAASKILSVGVKPLPFYAEGTNFVLLSGVHGSEAVAQEFHIPKDLSLDALYLESGYARYLGDDLRPPFSLGPSRFMTQAANTAKERGIPLIAADLPYTLRSPYRFTRRLEYYGTTLLSSYAISGLAGFFGMKWAMQESSRRLILARTLAGILGVWGNLELARQAVIGLPLDYPKRWQAAREAMLAVESLHPENINNRVRTPLIGRKLLFVGQHLSVVLGKEPTIGIAIGEGHDLIKEHMERGSQHCLRVLDSVPLSLLRAYYGETFDLYYPNITLFTYPGGSRIAERITDPLLQKRISPSFSP